MTRLNEIKATQIHEVILSLAKVGTTVEELVSVVGDPEKARSVRDAALLPIDGYLPTIKEQYQELVKLSERTVHHYGRIPKRALHSINLESDHVQTISDFEFLYVAKSNPMDTLRFNEWLLGQRTNSSLGLYVDGVTVIGHIDRSPGVHRLRIDLSATSNDHEIENADEKVLAPGRQYAGIEMLGALAMCPEVLTLSGDYLNLPEYVAARLQMTSWGRREKGGARKTFRGKVYIVGDPSDVKAHQWTKDGLSTTETLYVPELILD